MFPVVVCFRTCSITAGTLSELLAAYRVAGRSTKRHHLQLPTALYVRPSPIATKTPGRPIVACHSLAWIPESSRFTTRKKRSRSAVSARRSTATKDAGSHCEEITYGSFEPTSALPEGAAPWNAEYRNGVRELTAAARRPRRIRANTAPRSKRIAACDLPLGREGARKTYVWSAALEMRVTPSRMTLSRTRCCATPCGNRSSGVLAKNRLPPRRRGAPLRGTTPDAASREMPLAKHPPATSHAGAGSPGSRVPANRCTCSGPRRRRSKPVSTFCV